MRDVIFRILAGVLAVGLAVGLIFGDRSEQSVRVLAAFWAVAVVLGAFAVFGTRAAEHVLALLFGTHRPRDRQERDHQDDGSATR